MNAKQRKQTAKMRERTQLDLQNEVELADRARTNMERDKRIFSDWCDDERKRFDAIRAPLKDDRDELARQVAIHAESMKEERRIFQETAGQLENVSILRDVLVSLECGLEPIDIAMKLRKDFQILIPQW
ncbi:hypothetical protein D3C81_1742820 [compost metagenome]